MPIFTKNINKSAVFLVLWKARLSLSLSLLLYSSQKSARAFLLLEEPKEMKLHQKFLESKKAEMEQLYDKGEQKCLNIFSSDVQFELC